jgi:hypothetical protein
MVAAVPAIPYYCAYMCGILGLVIMYYVSNVSILVCVWNTYYYFYFMLGIHFHILSIIQFMTKFINYIYFI